MKEKLRKGERTSLPERHRISAIPRWTLPSDVLLRRATVRFGGAGLLGGAGRVSPTASEEDWREVVEEHVFQKPPRREKARPEPLYKREGRIEWKTEVIEDYDGEGRLGIIVQFAGISFTEASVQISRHSRPGTPVFYTPIDYNKKTGRLFLATRRDIVEAQVVPGQMYVNPFFQEELYLPQLPTTHNPASMAVRINNGVVIVGYNPRT